MQGSGLKRAHVYVSGRVQGVFFRSSTRKEAEKLGLSGWVKNLPDGRVEAVFEGPADSVEEMVGWCEAGPLGASVEDVERNIGAAEGDLDGFEVR